jgi:hypothetical protein
MLENYYDVKKAAEFDRLFGHLAIGQNPTPDHNRYFILHWDFSAVRTSGTAEQLAHSLYGHINGSIELFKAYYRDMLDYDIELDETDALRSFHSLLAAIQTTPYKLYLLIDEYDNFANEVLTAVQHGGRERYLELVEGEGVLKSIFKTVKYMLGGRGLERVFITGVSPIVVNDMTSGFNIVKNITLAPDLNELCGFREAEIVPLLEQVGSVCGFSHMQMEEALSMLRVFYNGYRFAYDQPTLVYNPTLVLYFLEHLQTTCQYPWEMLDTNLSMDRQKIAYIAHLPNGKQVITHALNEETPLAISKMAERFGVHDIYYQTEESRYIVSLLYYFGVLTVSNQQTALRELIFTIPNLVTRQLYLENIRAMLLPQAADRIYQIARLFAQSGDMAVVCAFIEQTYFPLLDNRDYRWANELSLKIMFLTIFADTSWYLLDSEASLRREYADVVMLVRSDMRQQTLLDFLLEFKYLRLPEVGKSGEEVRGLSMADLAALPAVAAQQAAAETKLAGYRATLHATYGEQLQLRCFSVVGVGFERLVWKEV